MHLLSKFYYGMRTKLPNQKNERHSSDSPLSQTITNNDSNNNNNDNSQNKRKTPKQAKEKDIPFGPFSLENNTGNYTSRSQK